MTVIIISLFAQLCMLTVSAQDSLVVITAGEAVQSALKQNQQLALAEKDELIAASVYKQTQAVFLPQVNLAYSALSTNNPLNAFGFKLQQKILQPSDFDPSLLNDPPTTSDFMTQISLQQPILNMDMIYQRKSAAKQIDVYHFKSLYAQAYIRFRTEQACLQLQLAYDAEAVMQESLLTSQAFYKFTNDRYDQGFLQKSDLLQAAVRVKNMESSLQDAKAAINNASDYLGLLMNQPPGIQYKIVATGAPDQLPGMDTLPASRADLKAMESAIQSYDLLLKSSKMSYLPKLNAFGNYQLHDKNIAGFGAKGWMAGLQLSWDIFKGNQTRNKIATQRLEKNKMSDQLETQKSESRVEISKARRQYQSAVATISTQESAVTFATESLRILQDRYQQGLVATTDVLTAQTSLAQQKLGYAQAVFAKEMALSYWRFLTTSTQQ